KDRIGAQEIADFKVRLGPESYAGQFQQRPSPAGGARFKGEWFRYYAIADARSEGETEGKRAAHVPVSPSLGPSVSQSLRPSVSPSPYVLQKPDVPEEIIDPQTCHRFA